MSSSPRPDERSAAAPEPPAVALPVSSAQPIDFSTIVRNLRSPLLVFQGAKVVYRNKAADRLAKWLHAHYATELVLILRDHIAQLGSSTPRDTLSLVRIPAGNHLLIDVSPIDGGYRVVGVRAPGLELHVIAAHYRLTPRELEVVEHVLCGHPNQTIADLLKVTPYTVKKHLTRVFDKVGVDSRTQLMSLVS